MLTAITNMCVLFRGPIGTFELVRTKFVLKLLLQQMLQENENRFVEEVMPEIINNQMYQAISFPSILRMEILRHNDSDVSIVQTFVGRYLEYQQQDRNRLLSTEARELVKLQNPELMVKLLEKAKPQTLLKLLEYNDFRQAYR